MEKIEGILAEADKDFKGKPTPKKSKKTTGANDENAKPQRKVTIVGYGLFLKQNIPELKRQNFVGNSFTLSRMIPSCMIPSCMIPSRMDPIK